MRVNLFSIGRFTVHSYGLLIALGVILALCQAMYRAKRKGLSDDIVFNMTIIAAVLGFAGAKLLFVIVYFRDFLASPLAVLGSSGFIVYGGLISGIVSLIIYARIKKVSFIRYADLMIPSVALAQAFGRLGCFFAGCCYGKPTDAFWGVTFPEGCFAPAGISLIPTQLISSCGDLLIMLILILFSRRAKKVGDVFAHYLILYGVGRFCVELLRTNEQGGFGPFTTAQTISIVFVAIGLSLFAYNRKSSKVASYGDVEENETASEMETEEK